MDPLLHRREYSTPFIRPGQYTQQLYATRSWVNNLAVKEVLLGHHGCVNSLRWSDDGALLLSGSDDATLRIYDAYRSRELLTLRTSHSQNIFDARFVPHTSNGSIIACSRDRTISIHSVDRASLLKAQTEGKQTLSAETTVYTCHGAAVKQVEPEDSPYTFYSVSEDGTLRRFDTRESTSCGSYGASETTMCHHVKFNYAPYDIGLYGLSINTLRPNYIAVCGTNPMIYMHDKRMFHQSSFGGCVRRFQPSGLINPQCSVSAIQFSRYRGDEIIGSWMGDGIYKFNIDDTDDDGAPIDEHDQEEGREDWEYLPMGRRGACDLHALNCGEKQQTDEPCHPSYQGWGVGRMAFPMAERRRILALKAAAGKDKISPKRTDSFSEAMALGEYRRAERIATERIIYWRTAWYRNWKEEGGPEAEIRTSFKGKILTDAYLNRAIARLHLPYEKAPSGRSLYEEAERDCRRAIRSLGRRHLPEMLWVRMAAYWMRWVGEGKGKGKGRAPIMEERFRLWSETVRDYSVSLGELRRADIARRAATTLTSAYRGLNEEGGVEAGVRAGLGMLASLEPFQDTDEEWSGWAHGVFEDEEDEESDSDSEKDEEADDDGTNDEEAEEGQEEEDSEDHFDDAIENMGAEGDESDDESDNELVGFLDRSKPRKMPVDSRTEDWRDQGILQPLRPCFPPADTRESKTRPYLATLRRIHRALGPDASEAWVRPQAKDRGEAKVDRRFEMDGEYRPKDDMVDAYLPMQADYREILEHCGYRKPHVPIVFDEDTDSPLSESMVGQGGGDTDDDLLDDLGLEVPNGDFGDPYEDEFLGDDFEGGGNYDDFDPEYESNVEWVDGSGVILGVMNGGGGDFPMGPAISKAQGQRAYARVMRVTKVRWLLGQKMGEGAARFITRERKRYGSHVNVDTVKGVNFWGPQDEYVVSGSDDGGVYIWCAKTGKLLRKLQGDTEVVNCIQGHPTLPMLAVSGIEDTIKIFSPDAELECATSTGEFDDPFCRAAGRRQLEENLNRLRPVVTMRMAGGMRRLKLGKRWKETEAREVERTIRDLPSMRSQGAGESEEEE